MDAAGKLWQVFQRQSQGKKNVITMAGMVAALYAINKVTQTRKRPEKAEVRRLLSRISFVPAWQFTQASHKITIFKMP
jgi:hypothetical protein